MNWTIRGYPKTLPTMEDRWLSVENVAAYLGVQPDTIYKWIQRKRMPVHRVGRLWKFKTDEVDAWVRSGAADDRRKKGADQ